MTWRIVLFMRPCGTVEPRKKVDRIKSKSFLKYEPGAKVRRCRLTL